MKTTIRHIIFEFTLFLYSDEEIVLGFTKKSKKVNVSKDISALGFIVGESNEFINKQIIFYN
jgi:hypothetical protein